MPFGLTNAPSTFQAAMNDHFRSVLWKFVLVFFDDILVYSPSIDAHYEHLRFVFHTLISNQFYAKASKCMFVVHEIPFLGHIISAKGVQADPKKLPSYRNGPLEIHLRHYELSWASQAITVDLCNHTPT